MNYYKMIRLINIFIFLLFSICTFAQKDTLYLKIKSNHFMGNETSGYIIQVYFEENSDKCDPNTGFVSLEQQKIHFEEALKIKNIDFKDFKRNFPINIETPQREYYTYIANTEKQVDQIKNICINQFLNLNKFREDFSNYTLRDQDIAALEALKKTEQRAHNIAAHLGYSEVELMSIDDVTSRPYLGFREAGILMSQSMISYDILANYRLIK
ncbi:MAG: hypothetical protein V3V14_09345 [Saprospiraceae bacterium]